MINPIHTSIGKFFREDYTFVVPKYQNRDIADYSEWSLSTMKERQEALIAMALAIFSLGN